MNSDTSEWIWQQIESTIGNIVDSFSSEEKNKFGFRLTYEKKTRNVIFSEYELIRNELKQKIYSDAERPKAKIDQHKIAACFCKALIQKKVFSFDIDDSITPRMLLSNYELAYTVSLRIIYIYLLDYYSGTGNYEIFQKLMEQKTLAVPDTTVTHDKYHEGRKKTLALNDYYGISFDLLTYSDMMYWIEHYNRQILENLIIVEPFDIDKK